MNEVEASTERGAPPLLEARGICKRYGHVEALKDCDLDIRDGEIVGLIGDNGAGKSTLVEMLTGVGAPDEGEIRMRGKLVQPRSPADARALGIDAVHQELALAPDLSAVYNFHLGREIVKPGL